MYSRYFLILFFALILFVPTTSKAQIRNEDDMVSALASLPSGTGPAASALFLDHRDLISKNLFDKLIARADQLSGSDDSKSLHLYDIAMGVAEQLQDNKLIAYGSYKMGILDFKRGDIPRAKLNYLRSKAALEQIGRPSDLVLLLSSLANVCLYQESLKEAKDYSQQSVALANVLGNEDEPLIGPVQYGLALSWGNLGDLAKSEGKYDEALTYYQKAVESIKALSQDRSEYRADLADSLADIGRVYRVMGDHVRALHYLNEAVAIAKGLSGQDKLASVLNSIGVLYIEQNDYDKASDFISRSLAIYRSIGDRFEIARLLLNRGVINQRQARYQEAIRDFQESLESANAVEATDLIVACQEGIGAVYEEQGNGGSALEWLGKALSTARKVGDKTRQAELLWRSGEAYYLKRDFARAIISSDAAADLASELRLPIISYLALTARGKYQLAQNDYEHAFENLSRAIEQIEALRDKVAGQGQERQLFLENKITSYALLVDLFVKQNKPADALFYAERAKARVLLDVLRDGKPDLSTVVSPSETREAQQLNLRISEFNNGIKQEQTNSHSDAAKLDELYAKLDKARLEYESFQDSLYVAHPELNLRLGRIPALNLEELTSITTDRNTVYLEYVATNERIYLFVITADVNGRPEERVYPISIRPEDLLHKVNDFHDDVANQRLAYARGAQDLYSILIAPAQEQIRNADSVCIIPDSFLWNVPFQALMTSNDHFLIEDHSVYYAPSLSVLREINRKPASNKAARSSLIAFGNPVIGKDEQRNTDLCPLPEAEQEVGSIAKFFPKTSNLLIGRYATEKAFKSLAQNYSVIHLATHGVIDNKYPLYSHLLLTKTDGDLENDGRLEARQIVNLNLPADLAVLSACETANGRIAPGEGVMGLSWAFFVAGTRATLVSQWKINSESTSELMTNFYKSLESDRSTANGRNSRALRSAQLTMISSRRYGHPFYWAGFVLIGN